MQCSECYQRLEDKVYMINAILNNGNERAISLKFEGMCSDDMKRLHPSLIFPSLDEVGTIGYLLQQGEKVGREEYASKQDLGYVDGFDFHMLFPRTSLSLLESNVWFKFPYGAGERKLERIWWIGNLEKTLGVRNIMEVLIGGRK